MDRIGRRGLADLASLGPELRVPCLRFPAVVDVALWVALVDLGV